MRTEQPIPDAVRSDIKIERPEPSFRTPEQVANDTTSLPDQHNYNDVETGAELAGPMPMIAAADIELSLPEHATPDKPAKSTTVTLFRRWTVSKKKLIIVSVAAFLLLTGGGTAFALTHSSPAPKKVMPTAKTKIVKPPAPKPILSPLTGIPVSAAQQKLPVIGVMIENSPDARPQSGLKDAGVVYEAIAEAGITRFLALYQEAHPSNVGPIRSSRPYYLDWAMAFDAAYAHVGGSPDALQRIKDIGVRDMDQFFNPVAYHRVTSRYAPHNVYSSIDQLTDLAVSKGYDTSTFTGFERKAEKPYKPATDTPSPTPSISSGSKSSTPKPATDTRTPVNTIDFSISSAYYGDHYEYDGATNTYKRSEGGAVHMDADSNTQLAPKVVIALAMPYSLMDDGYHSMYTTTGSGKMYVFQDGTVVSGTWSKGQPKDQFVFNDDAGKVIQLNSGQTWISVVADAGKVTYQ